MRNRHYLSSIHLSKGQKRAKKSFATLFITALMSIFYTGMQAQTVSVLKNNKVTISTKSIDECSSILEVSLSSFEDEYYFDFYITEDGEKLTSSDIRFEGEATVFQFNEHNNIKFESGSYNGRPTTYYLNTRNGKPYTFSSEKPSMDDAYVRINGKTTINEGENVSFTSLVCPSADDCTYQWYEDGTAIEGATSSSLSDHTPKTAKSTYKLEVSKNGSLFKSATVSIRTLGKNKRFEITPWWGISSSKFTEIAGYCNSLYMVEMTFNGNEPQFALSSDGEIVSELGSESSIKVEKKMGDDGTAGWKITNSDMDGKSLTFYIDARTTPMKLTDKIEEKEFFVPSIQITKGSHKVERGEAISFGSDICKSSSSELTYQWQYSTNNGTSWTAIDGGTSSELTDYVVPADGTQVRLVVSNGSFSNASDPITIIYAPSEIAIEIEPAEKINETEFEVPVHEIVNMKVIAERMSDAVISVKVKDFSSNTWKDTTFGTGDVWTFVPKENLVYKITADGTLNNTNEKGSITREFILRIIYKCDKNAATDVLWHDDFGSFTDASTYVTKDVDEVEQTHSGSVTDENGNVCNISNYMSADPNFFVKQHNFAGLDPLFGPYSSDNCASDGYQHYACWEDCNGIRVEDGYYAILSNPNTSNCGREDRDYWDGGDHTGNTNGGMLFVNCSNDSKGAIIYERELTLSNECDNVQLLFSAFISNAAVKEGQKPVNVRLDILDENKTLVHSVASGDVMPRTTGEKWSNMTFQFKSTGKKKYIIQLTNNNPGGADNYGNDILLDDISITICYPNVKLIADLADKTKDVIETCQLDTTIKLYAFNEIGIKNYIDEPVYLFQYKKADKPDSPWQDIETAGEGIHMTDIDNIAIKLDRDDARFFGTTKFRAIVASSKEVLTQIIEEEDTTGKITMTVDCDHVYAIDSAFTVIFHYSGPMGPDIDTAGCIKEVMTIIGGSSDKPMFKWLNAEDSTLISEGEKSLTFDIDGTKDDYYYFFVGTEELGCTDTQKVHVRKKENVWFDAPKEFVVCEFDSAVTLTDIVLKNGAAGLKPTFSWELNGEVDATQTGSKFKIPETAPLEGDIKVTGSAEGFCDSTRTIKYTIHKKYELKLDTDVEDDRLCFNTTNNTVKLTATFKPETARPNKFYWYNNGVFVGESDGPEYQISITENGKYKFTVKSTDDICYKDTADSKTPVQVDSISASRSMDMEVKTVPENAIICEGESIQFNLKIGNALDDKDATWECDDFEGGKKETKTENFLSSVTITPTKTNDFTENRIMSVRIYDEICGKDIKVKTEYEVHNKIKLSIDPIDTYCLSAGDKIDLTATVISGVPTKYVWLEGETRLDSTADNQAKITIKEGSNNYSVIASDDVCESKTSDVMTTEARQPITIDIMPKDTVFCEGTTITFRATIENALDKVNVPVIWSGDDLAKDSTIKGERCTLTLTPAKSNVKTEQRSITISTADEVCGQGGFVKSETTYSIHNKMDIAIEADRTDGLFCLTDKGGNDQINLKVNVKAGEPTLYNWYKDEQALGSAIKGDTALTIGEGSNQYKVVASDGICNDTSSVVFPIKARHQLGLDLNPKNASICEGEEIKLTATLTDVLNDDITVSWEGDDIAEGSTTSGNPSSYTVTTTKTGNKKQVGKATIKATDAVCLRDTVVSVEYNVFMKVDIQLVSDIAGGRICKKDPNSSKATLTIKVKKGDPNSFIWNDGKICAGNDTIRTIELTEGTNTFSVSATDDVCNKKDVSEAIANNSIETREPIEVDLFLDNSLVCIGNQIKATASIKNSHEGATSVIKWSDGQTVSNASNGEHSESFTPSVGSQSINVSVVDAKSDICPATVKGAVISAQDSLRLFITPSQETLCQRADTTQYIKLTVGIKTGWPSNVVWSTGDTTRIDTTNTTHILVGPNTNTVYWAYGTDNICKNSDKIYTKEIQVSNKLQVEVEIEKPEFQMGEEVNLIANLSNDEYNTIKWYNTETGEFLGETSDNRFTYQLKDDAYGIFKFGVVVDNMYCGDITSGKRKITVADYTEVPNIITPYNSNGKNDVFMGPKDGKPGYKVEIYNRYQQLIFEGDEGWDGIYRGYMAEPGTYFYRVHMKDGRVFKGTLEVAKF